MENITDRSEWHRETAIRLSRLSTAMCQAFTYSHDAVQTPEYNALYEEYMDLQSHKAQHDMFEPPQYKDRHQIG